MLVDPYVVSHIHAHTNTKKCEHIFTSHSAEQVIKRIIRGGESLIVSHSSVVQSVEEKTEDFSPSHVLGNPRTKVLDLHYQVILCHLSRKEGKLR